MRSRGLYLLSAVQWVCSVYSHDLGLFARSQPSPSPISIPPSQNWDGDDGPWSSFTIQVGTPAQDVRVFVSPATNDILVVSTLGCVGASDSTCQNDRGGLFNSNQSSSWQQHGYYELNLENGLGINAQGVFGNDTVTLGIQGSGGPTLQNQIVSAYTDNALYIGMFGLSPLSTNFTPTDQDRPSYLSSLKTSNIIPSLSFGYTAGNQYRLKQVYGSLALGGYDSSLFTPNNISIPFGPGPTRQLLAGLQTVKSQNQNGTGATLLSNGIMISIDPTVSMMWLPETVCQQFEKAFGLVRDSKTGLYLVNSDLHSQLTTQNASVTFTLGAAVSGGQSVDITLPYASFDLVVKPPAHNVGQSTKYFPLMPASNDSQYTLGRVFLQEAYLIVDWEHQNFSISACIFAENSHQSLVAIPSATSSSSSSGSSKVGIAVGVTVGVVVLIAAAIALYFVIRRRKRRQGGANGKNYEDPSEKIRQGFDKGELGTGHDNQRYEMAGSDPNQAKKTDDNDIPGWVNEKANYPGDRAGMVEADGGDGSARAELGGPGPVAPRSTTTATVRPSHFHEMHDPHSAPRFELPADTPGELQGSTPGSSVPASPVSSTRPGRHSRGASGSAGIFRSPFSKPTSSPLSAAAASSGSPHQSSSLDRRLDTQSSSSAANPASSHKPSRSSILGFGRLRGGNNNRASAASGPSSEYSRDSRGGPASQSIPLQHQQHSGKSNQPSDSDGPTVPPHPGRSSNTTTYTAVPNQEPDDPDLLSPVSRRGTFERSGTPGSTAAPLPPLPPGAGGTTRGLPEEDISSPISPQSPDADERQHQGLWGRLRRS